MRRLGLAVAALLAAPAGASAAPFGELPFRPLGGAATCLVATGAPGELARWTRAGVELLHARRDGLAPSASIPLGRSASCPRVASAPNGAAVAATANGRRLRVAVRDPGAAFGAPVTIAIERGLGAAVATSPRGDAIVAWVERQSENRTRLRVIRRAPGGDFGAPELLARGLRVYPEVDLAMTPDGEAFALVEGEDTRLTSARAGAPIARLRRIAGTFGSGALAVGPDGRVLIATSGGHQLNVLERPPGQGFVRHAPLPGGSVSPLAIALRPDGAALIVGGSDEPGTSMHAVMRGGPGAFGAPVEVARGRPTRSTGFGISLSESDGPPITRAGDLRAVLAPDGRALVGWGTERRGARVASLTAGGAPELGQVGGTIREAADVTPLVLADGTRAVAWVDNNHLLSSPPYAGRLHFALEGGAEAAPAVPELELAAPRDRSLRPSQSLVLPVRCSAACDIRASIGANVLTLSLPRAGSGRLRFAPLAAAIAPRRPGPVAIRLRWSAPGARESRTRTVDVRLRRLAPAGLPRIEGLRATRRPGGVVDVRWRTDIASKSVYYAVIGSPTRRRAEDPVGFAQVLGTKRKRSFSVRLRASGRARYVHVVAIQFPGGARRTARVPIAQ